MAVRSGRTRPDDATLSRLYVEEALTIAALAARFEVTPQTVHNWLVAAGVPRRPGAAHRRADIRDDDIRRLYVQDAQAAAEIGPVSDAAQARCTPASPASGFPAVLRSRVRDFGPPIPNCAASTQRGVTSTLPASPDDQSHPPSGETTS